MSELDKNDEMIFQGVKFSFIIDGLDVEIGTFDLEMKNNGKIVGAFSFRMTEYGLTFDDVYSYVKNIKNKTIKIQYLNNDNVIIKETNLVNVDITKITQSISRLQTVFLDIPISIDVKFSAELVV